ncbi:MAG: hypothetical protein MNSN_01650 [Minisyncoccus archaeiphilus]|uniref:hypothetical protein n=1 Tax=Minisyncoccus archaeiphilus TaxID=3238481 RepID=UPI002B1442B2|nr:MAG: hypothetical protein MNSN_01650 [Candidatus Parcubacteria bacterium]
MIDTANIWFYSLSTSAQVMAGIFGLFAVFVIFKLGDINQKITDSRNYLLNFYSDYTQIQFKDSNDKLIEESKKRIEKHKVSNFPAYDRISHVEKLEKAIKVKKEIIDDIICSLILSSFSILLSIILLNFTDFFYRRDYFVGLVVNLVVFIFTLGFIVFKIIKISKE